MVVPDSRSSPAAAPIHDATRPRCPHERSAAPSAAPHSAVRTCRVPRLWLWLAGLPEYWPVTFTSHSQFAPQLTLAVGTAHLVSALSAFSQPGGRPLGPSPLPSGKQRAQTAR